MGFGSLSLVKPLWPLFLCFSFGISSWPILWLVYIPAFSRFQICSRSSVCSISLPLRAFNMLQPLDWFVSAAFTTHHILRKSQQLAHKGLVAIPRLHLPALRTEQHILAGLCMGAECLQASGVWECLPPPGVALQPGVWAQQYLLSSQGQRVDKNSRQRGAGDTEMGPVYLGSLMTPGHLKSLKWLWSLKGRRLTASVVMRSFIPIFWITVDHFSVTARVRVSQIWRNPSLEVPHGAIWNVLLRGGLDSIWQSVQAERKVTAEKNPELERCELQKRSGGSESKLFGGGVLFGGFGLFCNWKRVSKLFSSS